MRPERFVTQKYFATACKIAGGTAEILILGDINIYCDWGWAPDYVEAIWAMTQQPEGGHFFVATGKTVSLSYFIERIFAELNMDWRSYVKSNSQFLRPSDIRQSYANPARTHAILGWHHKFEIEEVVREMVQTSSAPSR